MSSYKIESSKKSNNISATVKPRFNSNFGKVTIKPSSRYFHSTTILSDSKTALTNLNNRKDHLSKSIRLDLTPQAIRSGQFDIFAGSFASGLPLTAQYDLNDQKPALVFKYSQNNYSIRQIGDSAQIPTIIPEQPIEPQVVARTLYFNGAEDEYWTNLNNWWEDETFSTPAASLPISVDDVIASATLFGDYGGVTNVTVANFTFNGNGFLSDINLTVTGVATFNNDSASDSYVVIYGNSIYNDAALCVSANYGDCVFNDNSYNNTGYITGDIVFNDNSYNDGTVIGNVTFNHNSRNNAGAITGNVIFNNSSYNYNIIDGEAIFNDNSYNDLGAISGIATFNDFSWNRSANINPNSVFNSSYNAYDSYLLATFTNGRYTLFFNGAEDGDWNNLNNWYQDIDSSIQAPLFPAPVDHVVASAYITTNTGSTPTVGSFTMTDPLANFEQIQITLNVLDVATFTGSTWNAGTINGNVIFNDNSSNQGYVIGTATFTGNACNDGGGATTFIPDPPPSC